MKKTSQEESKIHNSRLVLRTIYAQGEISRANVSRLTGLTRTTVSDIVSRFIQQDLVVETGTSPSRGGKPAILLNLADDSRHLLGIDLANSEFRGAVINLRGKVLHRINLPVQERDGEAALSLVFTLIKGLLALTDKPILGIGIGTPGLMDPHAGVVRTAVNLDWRDLPLADLLQEEFNLPTYVANDCQVAALAEFTFNRRQAENNLVVVKVGRGIGAGIILDGKLFYGDNFGAGEIGHMEIVKGGEPCLCGNYGCLETVASSRAIIRRARTLLEKGEPTVLSQLVSSPDEINTDVILKAFEAGDPGVQSIVDEVGQQLGFAIAHLVCALNINRVVIAGSLARFGDRLTRTIQEHVEQGALRALAGETRIEISPLGRDIVILGAASLILSNEVGLV